MIDAAKIKCPFFRRFSEKERGISCEGFCHEMAYNILVFPNSSKKEEYIKDHCFLPNGGGCLLAHVLFNKYDIGKENGKNE